MQLPRRCHPVDLSVPRLSWQMALDKQDYKNPDDRIQDHKSQELSTLAMNKALMTFGFLTVTRGEIERGGMLLPFGHRANGRYVGL